MNSSTDTAIDDLTYEFGCTCYHETGCDNEQNRVNAKKKLVALLSDQNKAAQLKEYQFLLAEHDATCGATFAENERDDCTLRQQIFDRLKALSPTTNKPQEEMEV